MDDCSMLFVRGGSQVTGFHDPLCEGRTTQQRENDGRKHFSYVSLYLSHSSGYSSFNVMPSKAMPSLSVMASFCSSEHPMVSPSCKVTSSDRI